MTPTGHEGGSNALKKTSKQSQFQWAHHLEINNTKHRLLTNKNFCFIISQLYSIGYHYQPSASCIDFRPSYCKYFLQDKKFTYTPIKNTPSEILLSAEFAPGFLTNSTMPSPVDLPLSSTITTHLSRSPNWENDCSRSSFDTYEWRFLTLRAAPWVANRILRTLPFLCKPSRAALAASALCL